MVDELIDEVKFCIRCGNLLNYEERAGRMRPVCHNCGWIYFPDPKVAVAGVIESDGKILFVRRAVNPFKGRWTLPAGFVDAGEAPADALMRECLEEIGLNVQVEELLDVLFGQEHPGGSHILIVYKLSILDGELFAGDDVDMADFFDPTEPPPTAFSTTHQILQHFL